MVKLLLAYSSTNPAFGTVFRISLPLHFKIFQPPSGGSAHAGLGLIRASAFNRGADRQTQRSTRRQKGESGQTVMEAAKMNEWGGDAFLSVFERKETSPNPVLRAKLCFLSMSSINYWRTLQVHISNVIGQKDPKGDRIAVARANGTCRKKLVRELCIWHRKI